MGILYGIAGMAALIGGFWGSSSYTYGTGIWLVAVSMAPGALAGVWSAYAVAMTGLPEMVGAYNGFGGLAAALTGIGLYLDPDATNLVRGVNGQAVVIGPLSSPALWVQAIALILSIVIVRVSPRGWMLGVCV